MTDRELMQYALRALEASNAYDWSIVAALRERLAQPFEHNPWKNVALRLGEELSSVGPDGYYDMHPGAWLEWAMAQKPRGQHSLAQPQRTHWEGCEEVHPECRKPEQEPVAWLYRDYYNTLKLAQTEPPPPLAFPVYTTPPRREWVGLTDEERDSFWRADQMTGEEWRELFDAIEAKIKEKNA